jgi:C4-dicarboxylate-binding protein DctP
MKWAWRAVLVAAAIAVVSQSAAAERVLRLTLQLPITNVLGQNVTAFKEIVERDSAGAITVEIYASAELYKDKEVPGAVSSGAIEMGVAPVTRFSNLKPAVSLFNLPFLFGSNEDIAAATAPGHPIRVALDREILATGARPLWWQAFGLAIMLGKDEAPLHPDSLKGRKTRVFGATMKEFVAAIGGNPVPVSGSQQYEAYQRGEVDFGMTGITAVKSRKLYEVMGHLVKTNHAALEFVVVINEALWGELSEAERAIIEQAAAQVERDLRQSYRRVHQETLVWIATNTTMAVHDLDAAQLSAWRDVAAPVYESYIERAGQVGDALLAEARRFQ